MTLCLNTLFNANVRQVWGAGNWPDLSIWGEARFAGNLLTYANDVSQTTYWTATNLTVTGNSINNPADNRVTASKLLETVTSGQHKVAQTVTGFPSTDYQVSVYARPNGRDYIQMVVNDGTTSFSTFFNVQAGTIGTQANVTSANIQQYLQQPDVQQRFQQDQPFRETAQIGSVSGKIPSTATVDALLANHKLALIV